MQEIWGAAPREAADKGWLHKGPSTLPKLRATHLCPHRPAPHSGPRSAAGGLQSDADPGTEVPHRATPRSQTPVGNQDCGSPAPLWLLARRGWSASQGLQALAEALGSAASRRVGSHSRGRAPPRFTATSLPHGGAGRCLSASPVTSTGWLRGSGQGCAGREKGSVVNSGNKSWSCFKQVYLKIELLFPPHLCHSSNSVKDIWTPSNRSWKLGVWGSKRDVLQVLSVSEIGMRKNFFFFFWKPDKCKLHFYSQNRDTIK